MSLTIVHLPFYDNNPYQSALMRNLEALGHRTIEGGGGGTFFGTALRTWKPDVLHFHWLHPYLIGNSTKGTIQHSLALFGQLSILRARGTKIVWTAHNLKSHESANPQLERALTKMFIRRCDAVIAHCEAAKTEVVKAFDVAPDKVLVVPHGNYIGAYPSEVSREAARAELDYKPEELVFGFVGQVRAYKGVLDLIDGFEELQKRYKQPLRLLIAGALRDKENGEVIPERVASNAAIRFDSGFVPDERLQFYLNASDVVVFPYRDILTSGAVLLAMSYGRACLAPRRGCIGETLDCKGGFLYDPESDSALVEAMQQAIEKRSELPAMGAHNLERARKWSWEFVAQRTNEVYYYARSGRQQRAVIARKFHQSSAL